MTGLTVLSSVTGFLRIVVVAAVLGTTYLGDTYASANWVPNLLFELFAAGALQAVLVPSLVTMIDAGDADEAGKTAGAILGLASLALGILSAIGLALGEPILRALMGHGVSPEVADAKVRLGMFFLWFFLPQTVIYVAGLVSSAALNARGRFFAPVASPIVNNVVVISAYLLFNAERGGKAPSLHLSTLEKVTLAGGTTLAVVAFCSVSVIAAWRIGWRIRPSLDWRRPAVGRVARLGAWAALYLAMTNVLMAAVFALANRIEGGVVAWQVGLTVFLLPHSVFSVPVLTALFPSLSRAAAQQDDDSFGRHFDRGVGAIAWFAAPATALLAALGTPFARAVLYGRSQGSDTEVGGVIAALALGLFGYGMFLFLTRVFYARNDARTPALVNVGMAIGGVVLLWVFGRDATTSAPLGAAYAITYTVGPATLFVLLCRNYSIPLRPLGSELLRSVVAGIACFLVARGVVGQLDGTGSAWAFVQSGVAGIAGLMGAIAVQAVLRRGTNVVPDLFKGGLARG